MAEILSGAPQGRSRLFGEPDSVPVSSLERLIFEDPHPFEPRRPAFVPQRSVERVYEKHRETPAPGLCGSCSFLGPMGFSRHWLKKATELATKNGTAGASELLAHGAITMDAFYRALAQHLDLPFVDAAEVKAVLGKRGGSGLGIDVRAQLIWCQVTDGSTRMIAAPDPRMVPRLQAQSRAGRLPANLSLTTPETLRTLLTRQFWPALLETAIGKLAFEQPAMSAHVGARFWQGVAAALLVAVGLAAFAIEPGLTAALLHLVLSLFFFSCVLLRLLATLNFRPPALSELERLDPKDMPVYSVLVCLYKEQHVVPDLIASLKQLKWPRSKLQILLVCEDDDQATLDALARQKLPCWFQIIHVPVAQPRTKPKALNYAMAFARGELITLYDAEDRPHPEQLEEAWQTFQDGDEKLACLQAPLVKANLRRNALTAMFHFEYAGLFRGLMPWVARAESPIMLGGTSNHFRRAALEKVGRWDPFNVTEDADLGLRLWRSGYRTAMITRPTLEDAPHTFKTWLPQRTRWFKGWMQTWIVHTREPLRLARNMSPRAFAITQILLTGTFISALLHPLVLFNAIMLSVWLLVAAPEQVHMSWIAWLDWSMILTSYVAFTALCWKATEPRVRREIGWRVFLVPVYWLAQSYAAWRAVVHLFRRPFEWEKTPHTAHQSQP